MNQPRVAELNAHNEKLQRHLRALAKKNRAHDAEFNKILDVSKKRVGIFLRQLLSVQAKLPLQVNLASLQGLLTKAKRARVKFVRDCDTQDSDMRVWTEAEPSKLLHTNAEFVNLLPPFEEGGNYNLKEIEMTAEVWDLHCCVT